MWENTGDPLTNKDLRNIEDILSKSSVETSDFLSNCSQCNRVLLNFEIHICPNAPRSSTPIDSIIQKPKRTPKKKRKDDFDTEEQETHFFWTPGINDLSDIAAFSFLPYSSKSSIVSQYASRINASNKFTLQTTRSNHNIFSNNLSNWLSGGISFMLTLSTTGRRKAGPEASRLRNHVIGLPEETLKRKRSTTTTTTKKRPTTVSMPDISQ